MQKVRCNAIEVRINECDLSMWFRLTMPIPAEAKHLFNHQERVKAYPNRNGKGVRYFYEFETRDSNEALNVQTQCQVVVTQWKMANNAQRLRMLVVKLASFNK